jgi:hypothetical protein
MSSKTKKTQKAKKLTILEHMLKGPYWAYGKRRQIHKDMKNFKFPVKVNKKTFDSWTPFLKWLADEKRKLTDEDHKNFIQEYISAVRSQKAMANRGSTRIYEVDVIENME